MINLTKWCLSWHSFKIHHAKASPSMGKSLLKKFVTSSDICYLPKKRVWLLTFSCARECPWRLKEWRITEGIELKMWRRGNKDWNNLPISKNEGLGVVIHRNCNWRLFNLLNINWVDVSGRHGDFCLYHCLLLDPCYIVVDIDPTLSDNLSLHLEPLVLFSGHLRCLLLPLLSSRALSTLWPRPPNTLWIIKVGDCGSISLSFWSHVRCHYHHYRPC